MVDEDEVRVSPWLFTVLQEVVNKNKKNNKNKLLDVRPAVCCVGGDQLDGEALLFQIHHEWAVAPVPAAPRAHACARVHAQLRPKLHVSTCTAFMQDDDRSQRPGSSPTAPSVGGCATLMWRS